MITVDHDYMISDWDDYSDWRALAWPWPTNTLLAPILLLEGNFNQGPPQKMPHNIHDQVDEHDHQDQYHIDAVSIITAMITNTNVFRVEAPPPPILLLEVI